MEKVIDKVYLLEDILDLYILKNQVDSNIEEDQLPNDEIDKQIERDFLDDVDIPDNVSEEVKINRIKRYQRIVNDLKIKYNWRCQLCEYSFKMDNGKNYCEAHHINKLSNNGSQSPENVIILCPNHHRVFHYASNTVVIGELFEGKRIITIENEEFTVHF